MSDWDAAHRAGLSAREAADAGWAEKARADEAKFKKSGLTLEILKTALNGSILDKVVKAPYPKGGTIKVWLDPGSPDGFRFNYTHGTEQEVRAYIKSKLPKANGPDPSADSKTPRLIKSSQEFVATYVAPDYVIHGVVQRNRLYGLTGQTGSGKTAVELAMAHSAATGTSLGGHEVEKGRVLYLAGENPDDVKGRWLAMAQHLDFDANKIDVDFIEGVFGLGKETEGLVHEAKGIYTLALVDTCAAFFEGDQFNDNKQQLDHALKLRRLTELPGRPAVIVGCHPVKNATENNLVPYGGGSLLNEFDGNLTCVNTNMLAEVHWQRKLRGPDFEPMHFELDVVTATKLRDTMDRPIPTVIARSVNEQRKEQLKATARSDEDAVLIYMHENPGKSLRQVAVGLGWKAGAFGEPYSTKVKRALVGLRKDKFAEIERDQWQLTAKGKTEAKRLAKDTE